MPDRHRLARSSSAAPASRSGYLHRPELTAERFVAIAPAPAVGCIARAIVAAGASDGLLEHLGRLDFQVKVRGHRIELGEIEANLARLPLVAQAVVVVREDQPGDVRLVAYIVCKDDLPASSELRDALRKQLPEYMLPQHFVALSAIPLLPNGKIDRHALPAPDGGHVDRRDETHFMTPGTASELAIARIWSGLLGIDRISTGDNFFDLGGHSLLAMRAVSEIERQLGVRLSVRRMIFETLAQIAATVPERLPQAAHSAKQRGWLDKVMGALRS